MKRTHGIFTDDLEDRGVGALPDRASSRAATNEKKTRKVKN